MKSLLPTRLIAEISLGSVTPYATQFRWQDAWGDGESWEANFEAVEGGRDEPQTTTDIKMTMTLWTRSQFSDSGEWQFAYFVRSWDDDYGWTTTAANSGAAGFINTFRLFRTIGEAIRDFANTHQDVDVIDITGSDMQSAKGAQKSRIYADFLRTNPGLNQFDVVPTARGLYLVRRGIKKTEAPKDPDAVDDDYWTPDGSEESETDNMGWTASVEER